MKQTTYELHTTGTGTFLFNVVDDTTARILASYTIVDYSTEQGCMYVVYPMFEEHKAMRCDTLVQAQEIAKADYMARA